MTSYFSVPLKDAQGEYTLKKYWYAFAGVMGVSFLGVFFLSALFMFLADSLDIVSVSTTFYKFWIMTVTRESIGLCNIVLSLLKGQQGGKGTRGGELLSLYRYLY